MRCISIRMKCYRCNFEIIMLNEDGVSISQRNMNLNREGNMLGSEMKEHMCILSKIQYFVYGCLPSKWRSRSVCFKFYMMVGFLLSIIARSAHAQSSGVQVTGVAMMSREVDTRVQFEVEEGKAAGTVIGTIPIKRNFTYRFNDIPEEFHLNGTTGTITTVKKIDREKLKSDRFDLVILSSQPTYPIEVRIIILDINDNSPTFPEPSIHVTFSESANIGTRVILDTATDGDAGINDITTNYKIVSGNENNVFRLVVTTNPSGEMPYLHLEITSRLDREVTSFYQLNISAQDGGSPPRLGFLHLNITILDVNDNPPIFDHSDYSVSLNESVPLGTSVLEVHATDNDISDNAKITYFLSETESQFSVDSQTGVISTIDFLSCPKNCPTVENCSKSCVFTVFARDHGSPRQDGRAYVTINLLDANDHDPIIRFRFFPSTASSATVDENAQNGSVVAAVSVIDFDEGLNGETTIEIQGGNEQSHFRLESTPSFDIVRVNGVLDREYISKYNLTITATDNGSPARSSTTFLIIHVNDVNDHEPVFERNEYSAVLSELVPVGTYVAGITATDEDTGINSNIYYEIALGNEKRWFNLDFQTGLITTAQKLNREELDFVELKISARDGGPNPRWAHTYLKIQILDENDEYPVFSKGFSNISLSEDAPPGSLVTVMSATDNDLGTNGSVLYYLDQETDKKYPNMFELDYTFGRLTIKSTLDREKIAVYFIKVVAQDQGIPSLSSTVDVQVNVLDINDNNPVFYPKRYFSLIPENVEIGTSVLQITASDLDEGQNSRISFFNVEGIDELFEIDELTGVIKTKAIITEQVKSRHELIIGARHPGDDEATENAVVMIYIDDQKQKQYSLEFSKPNGYQYLVTEDSDDEEPSIGREVGRVSLKHTSDLAQVKYAITSGDPLGWFHIDDQSGGITTAQRIDRELKTSIYLVITAYNEDSFVTVDVRIQVNDKNDYIPKFMSSIIKVKVLENWPVGHEVYLAKAEDLDVAINGKISYSLSINHNDIFIINADTGMIYLNKPMKFKTNNNYDVEVVATDRGIYPLSSRQHIVVIVEDVNDHTPVFDRISYETSVLESIPINDRFFSIIASDEDSGENGHVLYEIKEGNDNNKFGIFPDGFLYVKATLDREKRDYYSLIIEAKDNGTKSRHSKVSVVVHVIDVNDNIPKFDNNTLTFYISENEPLHSYVGKLSADDNDKDRNAELTFSISTNQNDFVVDPKSGIIRTLKKFDREKQLEISGHDYIVIEVLVEDGGLTRLRDEAKVTVYITDVNDNAPQFLRTPYKAVISEGAPLQTQVIRVSAIDADEGVSGNVVYFLTSGNEGNYFQINENTGQITLFRTLDREKKSRYNLKVMASDTGKEFTHNSTVIVMIDVLDENDNSPSFTVQQSLAEISEIAPVGYKIFHFSATDADQGFNGDISFSIVAGNINEVFQIDSTSGVLYLDRQLDFEEKSIYYLNISAIDGGAPRLISTLQFQINIIDVNDNPPYFSNVAIVRQIEEGIPIDTPVVTVIAEDRDSGLNGKVLYNLTHQQPPGNHFAIDHSTGVIYTIQEIDREFSDTFRLTVSATDQALLPSSRLSTEKNMTIIVEDVNDNAPTFVSMDAGVLPENSDRGYKVMTLSAVDKDANSNGVVSYELIEGEKNIFFLDRNTGELYLSRQIEKPQVLYSLIVQATDEAILSSRKSSRNKLTVIGTMKRPQGLVFSASEYSGSIFENEPIGTTVLSVRAQYPSGQSEGRIEYYLMRIYSDVFPQQRVFAINKQNGVITTATVIDRENKVHVYELEVYAVDVSASSPRTSKTKVTITIHDRNDSPPVFVNTPYKILLSEDAPPGYTVVTISAVDPDVEGTISYTLVDDDDSAKFQFDSQSGVLLLKNPLDRETEETHQFMIQAFDGIQTSGTKITIEVTDSNDNPPVFKKYVYSFDVPEEVQRGAEVGVVCASDTDVGINGQVSYSVISDWGNDVFSLNPQNGVFTLISHLDYEQVQHYIFIVQAQDSGYQSLSSTVTVYFNVLDLNDNAPLFDPMSYSDEVYENITVGSSIITVSATDLDSGSNGDIVFSIVEGDENNHFNISPNGTIFTIKPLDRETQSLYNLIISANDQAWPIERQLSSTVQVTIIMKDINDMSPEFISPNKTSVFENTPVNTVVMAVKAVDRDEGRNSYIEYSLIPTAENKFSLGPVDGLLRVNGPLDREIKSQYKLQVVANDRGIPPRSTYVNVVIDVLDENDNNPVFNPTQYSASVSENASIGLSVIEASATDQDEGLSGQVRYSIVSGDPNHDFIISEDTGTIRVSKNLDYERKNRYILTVQAEDSAGDIRYDTATVTIAVTNINDNPPKFQNSPYEVHVMENLDHVPTPIFIIMAQDADLIPNTHIHYLIKDGDKHLFNINSSSGEITAMKKLDREQQAEYVLTILAMDSGTPRQTGTGTVTVMVSDVNDNKPTFERSHYVAGVKENLEAGSKVLLVAASDEDLGRNGLLRYHLIGDHLDKFTVDTFTGAILTRVSLDREETDQYEMTLVARDSGLSVEHSSSVNITIHVEDENDNKPTFMENLPVYIPDSAAGGHFVFGAQAHDPDVGVNSRLVYHLSGMDADKFQISQDTGVVKLIEKLARKEEGYTLEIYVTDSSTFPLSANTSVKVYLQPTSLFPRFRSGIRNFVFSESTENIVVTTVSATSPKSAGKGDITYGIGGGNLGGILAVNSQTGEVRITSGLDYEMTHQYEVWVEARDSDYPSLGTAIKLTLQVTDANDNMPFFTSEVFNATVMEEQDPPQFATVVHAEDVDQGENGKVLYKFVESGSYENPFVLNSKTGEIFTSAKLDRESLELYKFVIEAVDHGSPEKTGTTTVFVTVLDKNDHPPRFTRLFSVNVTENAPLGSFVIQVTSSDRDISMNANATYSFTDNPGEKFHIDPLSGNVSVAGELDREMRDEYLLKVAAVDGSWRAETPLTISVQDVNDNAPEFKEDIYNFNFPELQHAVAFIGQVSACDRDKHGPNSFVTYSLKRPSDFFRIDPGTGEILSKQVIYYKRTSSRISSENQFIVQVRATDQGKPPLSSEVTVVINVVDSNNNPPRFEKPYYFSPVPDSIRVGASVLQVIAKDNKDVGINAEIEYVKAGGNGTDYFNIHKSTGWVTVGDSFLGLRDQWFMLKLRAIDRGVPPKSSEVIITFIITGDNKHSPVFSALSYQVIVSENEPLNSEIITVTTEDSEEGLNGEVTYAIVSGNSGGCLRIDEKTGSVSIVKALDYEKKQEYQLTIIASDHGFYSKLASATLTVIVTDVNDNPPIFNSSIFEAHVSENMPIGTAITQVIATDLDSGRNAIVQYSIVRGESKEAFSINSQTGVVTSRSSFDYETKNRYTLQVMASNPGSSQYSSTRLIVHVIGQNEYYPRFLQTVFQFTISESAVIGTPVGALVATDEDKGSDGDVFFLFVGSSNGRGFYIQSETGIITVSRRLDRELQSRVVLAVMVKNKGSIRGNDTDEAQVVINIEDGNDPPVFSRNIYEAQISESASVGSSVITVSAIDKDVRPNNNQFSYSIMDSTAGKLFSIDAQSGTIITVAVLDREANKMCNLTIGAVDNGSPPQTGSAVVQVEITDINDNGPIFDSSDVVGYVMENEPAFTSVMVLSATDPDLPPNGAPFTYFLIGGDHKEYFEIDRFTGLVKTTQSIDRESMPNIKLIVEVRDSGIPQMKAKHIINVVVMDKNDCPSSPRALTVFVWVYNKVFPGGKIADAHPSDPDLTGQYQCTLVKGDTSKFRIPSKCDLHAVRLQDPQEYTISVSGNDGRHEDVTSTVRIQFMNFDDLTVENSVTLRILNHSTDNFLALKFIRFQEALKELFRSLGYPLLYSITDLSNHLELTLAIQTRVSAYITSKEILALLSEKKRLLQRVVSPGEIAVGFDPCENSPCQNDGKCRSFLELQESLSILDSPSLVFTSPTVSRQFACSCPKGFSGSVCQYQQNPCSPNPCFSGGTCHHDGNDFHCICTLQYQGKQCESRRANICASSPCRNGGTCEEGPNESFFCLCRPGFRGSVCEQLTYGCRPNRCLNRGTCLHEKSGYRCICDTNFFGRHCEKSTFGFHQYSYMSFPSLKPSTNDISLVFSTNMKNSLLVYNFGRQSGGRSDFFAIEIVEGKTRFSFGASRSAIASIMGRQDVADGKWHKITVIRNGRVASLSVVECSESGELCDECSHGNMNCSLSATGHAGTLNFNGNTMYLGGVTAVDPLLERPGQVSSDDFVGCIHSVYVNGRQLDLTSPLKSNHITSTCPRLQNGCAIKHGCGNTGICQDLWFSTRCLCLKQVIAANCIEALEPLSFDDGSSYLELIPLEKLRRTSLLTGPYYHAQRWKRSISGHNPFGTKTVSFSFRTKSKNGLLLHATTKNEGVTILQLRNGHLEYKSQQKIGEPVNLVLDEIDAADGLWHEVVLTLSNNNLNAVNVSMDQEWNGLETEHKVHDVLDPYLTVMTMGLHPDDQAKDNSLVAGFQGCLSSLIVNGEVQNLNATNNYFKVVPRGIIYRGCTDEALGLDVALTDPLSIGVILVIVFFVILIVVILVSFLVFRRRKLCRDKNQSHIKQNGNAFLTSTNGDSQRSNRDSNYGENVGNDDVIRNHISQELVPKKMKDRDVLTERPQRPDIIEREVIKRSPAMSPQCSENNSHQDNPKPSNGFGMGNIPDSEPPEHYDLENASSIAPSDIDIVYHYKGFRDGNVRKYKTNSHIPNYHKHNHRHSPHQFQPSPIRESPRSVIHQNSSSIPPRESPSALKMQNTPLARLSPSSELSQQTPRILTLQDISGKPLQTALLATSQGVSPEGFKDPIMKSERSLTSPVSNISHNTGSFHSRPQSRRKRNIREGGISLGLTVEEIERLNARPRNSSLVSTLDAVSLSSDDNPEKNKLAEILETNTELLEPPDSSSDESGNDSFTCSEFEYDNNYEKVHRDFGRGNMIFSKLAEEDNENDEDLAKTYDGFDSIRGSLSTLVASDDDISNVSSYKPANGSVLGWDYLLNWGPNFQNLVGVFKDIAELPDTAHLATGHSKPNEEYV
ncbi:cadherin-related tumor suppressor-like [Tachypleus tridentatus]|uniref:cadherin-related tumor suppressor-like n=1 Tax=Tachypleus tridentatus TaxID=6853 RepID=UPI003FD24A1C